MPITAMCTRGTDVQSRPFPSFVTSTIDPVSATPKLQPEMPRSAREEPVAQLLAGEGGQRLGRGLEQAVVVDLGLQDVGAPDSGRGGLPGR